MALDLPSYLMGKSRGGGGGTSDYSQLTNKPSINGVTLNGNKTGADLGLISGVYDLRIIPIKNTPTQDDLAEAGKLITDLYDIYTNNKVDNIIVIGMKTNQIKLFEVKPKGWDLSQKRTSYSIYATAVYGINASQDKYCGMTELRIGGSWTDNTFTASTLVGYGNTGNAVRVLATDNQQQYSPIGDYNPATKKYADTTAYNNANPEVTKNLSVQTVGMTSLLGNKVYKYGTLSSLGINSVQEFDRETIFYFTSGSTGTNISLPDDLVNLGDAPTFTTASNVNTGTCDTNKNYIIAICNKIAVWKKY